jgi:hypothetical protein
MLFQKHNYIIRNQSELEFVLSTLELKKFEAYEHMSFKVICSNYPDSNPVIIIYNNGTWSMYEHYFEMQELKLTYPTLIETSKVIRCLKLKKLMS